MNDFTSSNQPEYELIRQKLPQILRSYSFPEKVSLANEYQLPPGVLAWLHKTTADAAQGNPDATTKSLDDEKDDVVKLIVEKLIHLIFTDSRNTSHEYQDIAKLCEEMRDFIASELCVHYAEDTIRFLLSHGDTLEFMQDTDAFLVSEGLSGHELAKALKTILGDASLNISPHQKLLLTTVAKRAQESSVQVTRHSVTPLAHQSRDTPADFKKTYGEETPAEIDRQIIEHCLPLACRIGTPVYDVNIHGESANELNAFSSQLSSRILDLRKNLIRLAKKEGWADVENELTRLFSSPPPLVKRSPFKIELPEEGSRTNQEFVDKYAPALELEALDHDIGLVSYLSHQIECYLGLEKSMLKNPDDIMPPDVLLATIRGFPFEQQPTPPKPAPGQEVLPPAFKTRAHPSIEAPPPAQVGITNATSPPRIHTGTPPPGATTILTAQQAEIAMSDFRIRYVESDGLPLKAMVFFRKKMEYTAIFCPNKHTEAIVKHAFPEARRSTKWSDKSEPPAMLVSAKNSPNEVRASLSKSLSAFRLDKQSGKVSFER